VFGDDLPDTGVGDVLKSLDDIAVHEVKDHGDTADPSVVPEGSIGVNLLPSEDDLPLEAVGLNGIGNGTVGALGAA
jgi:hypothetical protein